MSIEEFNATGWGANMKAKHKNGNLYIVVSCDFGEQLVGLIGMVQNAPEEITWVRCENVHIVRT